MLNAGCTVDDKTLKVLDYANPELEAAMSRGVVNVEDDQILEHIKSSILRGYPQMRPEPPKDDEICLVGGGPSLADTEHELRDLMYAGAKIVTVNGAYQWCLAHNFFPSMQIVLDARASNARFVSPAIPRCAYVLASQCAPETWDAVAGRQNVWVFHASAGITGPVRELLDAHYVKQWYGVGGGVTVATRAINLLRMVGYLRFHLFGIDSCWLQGKHHAYDQPENADDKRLTLTLSLTDDPSTTRAFIVSPWQLKQAEDFLQIIKVNGEHFVLSVHGYGLIAYMLKIGAGAQMKLDEEMLPDVQHEKRS